MTTDCYLKKVRYLNTIILNHADEYARLMDMATNIVAPTDSDAVQGSVSDRIGNTVAKMVDYSDGLAKMVTERDKIMYQLEYLPDVTSYNVLFRYYVLEESFMELSRSLNYSKTHIARLHRKALGEFEREYGATYLDKD